MTRARAAARELWRAFRAGAPTRGRLVEVHRRNKFLLLAHSEAHYRRLGRVVGTSASRPMDEVIRDYQAELEAALARAPSRGSHANALGHLAGLCKAGLSRQARGELYRAIEAFRLGRVSLEVPRQLIRRHARALGRDYVLSQTYLV